MDLNGWRNNRECWWRTKNECWCDGVETFDQVVSVKFLNSNGEMYEVFPEIKSNIEASLNFDNYAVSAVFKGTKGKIRN